MIWNRSASKCERLAQAGAAVACDPGDLFARCRTVILMLADGAAMDAVLGRGGPAFARRVEGRIVINMATMPPG